MIILYQITQLSEQKYKLAIHFAENNFGPFEHIIFVIVLFESPSKTLFRVFFASLYLQICIFYQYISISCPIVNSKWVNPNRKYEKTRQNNGTFVSYDPAKARNGFGRSNCTYTREFDVIPATGASYWPIIAQWTRVRVKTRYQPIFWKIPNKYFYWMYSYETFYTKALEYKEFFTHIAFSKMTKSLENIQLFLDIQYRMF
jgi:hypothetical protein